jgi:spermidine synthase
MDFLPSPIYSTGKKENIRVNRKIAEITSPFQNIMIVDTAPFGRAMVIDGLVQTSEKDHEIYDRAILEKLTSEDKKILVLGGGDGYVAQTALLMNPSIDVEFIDLDPEVVNFAKEHLNQTVFNHPQVHMSIGDAVTFMETLIARGDIGSFDGIVSDLTDNPVGGGATKKEMAEFYDKVFSLSHKLLKQGGWISAQAGASKVVRKYVDSAKLLTKLLEGEFGGVERRDIMIPSFSEKNCFLYSTKKI